MTPYQQCMLLSGNDDEPLHFGSAEEFFAWQAKRF